VRKTVSGLALKRCYNFSEHRNLLRPAGDHIDMLAMTDKEIAIGGFAVRDTDYDKARRVVCASLRDRRKLCVFFANTNFVTKCQTLMPQITRNPAVYLLNDGIGINLAAYLMHRRWFSQNMNGTDFVPRLLQDIDVPARVFLLGSTTAAVEGAAKVLAGFANVAVAGTSDGYSFWADQDALIATINASKADIVLVALGTPKQEQWILENAPRIDAPVLFAIGALLDFLSKQQPRAPLWMRRLNLEWLFRLSNEPRRLFRRYTIELFAFFRIVLAHGADERAFGDIAGPNERNG
jgi:beta-1,4-glucosyltransferase